MSLPIGALLENTQSGESLVVVSSGRRGYSEQFVADYTLQPGGAVAAAHKHPFQTETFEVVSGVVNISIDDAKVRAEPGSKHVVPPGVSHRMMNHGSSEVKLRSTLSPPLRSDELLETLWGLATDGKTNRSGYPNILQASVVAFEFRDEFVLARPPKWLQDLVFRSLAPMAIVRGYRGTYVPQYRR